MYAICPTAHQATAWIPTLFPSLDQRRPTADHNSRKTPLSLL